MENTRVLGNNITLLLNQNGIAKELFAEAVGYSLYDVQKLCDSRLFADDEDVEEIAKFFDISVDELLTNHGDDAYKGEGFMHCMGKFKNPKNKEKILDIFDMYCDMKEILNK